MLCTWQHNCACSLLSMAGGCVHLLCKLSSLLVVTLDEKCSHAGQGCFHLQVCCAGTPWCLALLLCHWQCVLNNSSLYTRQRVISIPYITLCRSAPEQLDNVSVVGILGTENQAPYLPSCCELHTLLPLQAAVYHFQDLSDKPDQSSEHPPLVAGCPACRQTSPVTLCAVCALIILVLPIVIIREFCAAVH